MNLSEDDIALINNKFGFLKQLTMKFSLGSYYQAYPHCHPVPVNFDNVEFGCRGSLKIQEIYDVNVFESGSNLCIGDAKKLKKSLN